MKRGLDWPFLRESCQTFGVKVKILDQKIGFILGLFLVVSKATTVLVSHVVGNVLKPEGIILLDRTCFPAFRTPNIFNKFKIEEPYHLNFKKDYTVARIVYYNCKQARNVLYFSDT